jgi:hypothetical protein
VTDPDELRRALDACAARRPGARDEGPVAWLERLCGAVATLLGADGAAGVAAAGGPAGRRVAVPTGPVAARLVEIEELVGDGPGTRAARGSGQSVTVRLGDAGRPSGLPEIESAVVGSGLPAVEVRAWPVRTAGRCVGALVLHTVLPAPGVPTPRWPGDDAPQPRGVALVAEADGQVLADALAPALLAVASGTEGAGGASSPGGPPHAGDAGDRLDRAVGMVVAQTGLPPEDARALLRASAWADGQRLDDAATAVLERRTRLADGDARA